MPIHTSPELDVVAPASPAVERVLSPGARAFLADLCEAFAPRLEALLKARRARQAAFDAGARPDFLRETASVRQSDWRIAPPPAALLDRRVEITGPVDRKMIINALNSGANVFMADFEDSTSPTWDNVIDGQVNLIDAVRREIRYVQPDTGKEYALKDELAVLMVRPRGLHLAEKNVRIGREPVPAALFDFALFFFHNADLLAERGAGPFFYLPKLQSHLEARWWNDVFVAAERRSGLPVGTIRATVLIETLPAAFEMDEILYELREHSAGLNCGRWDYIFSSIKTLKNDPAFVLPDRAQVTMEQPFLRAYTQLLVKTCHRRGAHAMGGMSAFIPVKDDPAANEANLAKVRADKLREATDGHDGTWVAHPGLVAVAREIFDARMAGPNQLHVLREDVHVSAVDLLRVPIGTRTPGALRHNIRVGVRYLEAWLRGSGCVPLDNLMEDAATAEICRSQIWQWIFHGSKLEDGSIVTAERFRAELDDTMRALAAELGPDRYAAGRFREAARLFETLCTARSFTEFLTLPAYDLLLGLTSTHH